MTTDTTPTAADAVAAYDRLVRANRTDDWDTIAAVATDDTGEAFSELIDTGAEIGYSIEDDPTAEMILSTLFDGLQAAYRAELAAEGTR